MKKSFILILTVLLTVTLLAGCSPIITDTAALLTPPKSSKDIEDIQKALAASVNGEFTLKYPTDGSNRSAIILKDLNSNGKNEAITFYTTTSSDNIVSMNINIIVNSGGKWVSSGFVGCAATGVETVDFADMDGDGVLEIIVGWAVYGTSEKLLGVYGISGGFTVQRMLESYTSYVLDEFVASGQKDIMLIKADEKSGTAAARLLKLTVNGTEQLGEAPLDATCTLHASPQSVTLKNGIKAVFVDGTKPAGTVTDIITVTNGHLKNIAYSETANATESTFRQANVSCRDINEDGIPEIPKLTLLTLGGTEQENVYRTDWYAFNGNEFTKELTAVMNYSDGYYIVLPEKWQGKITAAKSGAQATLRFMAIDKQSGNSAEELARIRTFKAETVAGGNYSGEVLYSANKERAYVLTVSGNPESDLAVTINELKSMLKLIEPISLLKE